MQSGQSAGRIPGRAEGLENPLVQHMLDRWHAEILEGAQRGERPEADCPGCPGMIEIDPGAAEMGEKIDTRFAV